MSENLNLLMYIKNQLSDLIYINGIIATELTKITENLAAIRHSEEFLKQSKCVSEHHTLNQSIIDIVKKYKQLPKDYEDLKNLEKHILDHDV
jgi:hypothetical protein